MLLEQAGGAQPLSLSPPRRRFGALATLKAGLLVAHLAGGLVLAVLIAAADALGAGRRVPRERIALAWDRVLLRILCVRVHRRGKPLRAPHLAVANHVSWLDIPVIGACIATRFISRHDVQNWPVAGLLADACGTFYVRRGGGTAHETLAQITPHLQHGSVVLFPEGTTSDGNAVLPFRSRLFEAALASGASVQPIALRYSSGPDGTPVAPFVGDMTLVGHLLAVLACRELHVEVSFMPAHVADEATTRDGIASQARRSIERVVRRGVLEPGSQATRSPAISGERYQ